ncbi:MAG: DNA polymerase III subunit gamma/tau [Clostridia bacterium]|nr:DNA polymerase III subunit gamma/tau [Clostridia bacterium]
MYQVLYRKWRPKTFSDVAGQEHITSTLSNEIINNKVSHAYLFTGSRGTGKTTCAKIFAKAVNCLNPVNGNPCCECEICKGIDNGDVLDVIELDAASNNGVDNIRDIIDESNFTPVSTKYRVYIIDEVHMLSQGAFNALLKTLEEPPEHVKFILATTEVHKIPSTILSRCQRFDFKRISPEAIAGRIEYVASQENIDIEKDAALLIARIADGALRDALSLLDRCSGTGEKITYDVVSAAAGLAGKEKLFALVDAVKDSDCSLALSIVSELHNDSCDMERLCSNLLNHYRNLMIVKTVKNPEELIICVDEDMKKYSEQSSQYTLQQILYCLSVIEKSLVSLKNSINKRIETEMTVVRLCSPEVNEDISALISRIEKLENAVKSGEFSKSAVKNTVFQPENVKIQKTDESISPHAAEIKKDIPAENDAEVSSDVPFDKWGDVISSLSGSDVPLMGILSGSSAYIRGQFVLIKCDNPTFSQFIKLPLHSSALKDAIEKITGTKYRLGIYKNPENSQPKRDPLADLINKINN